MLGVMTAISPIIARVSLSVAAGCDDGRILRREYIKKEKSLFEFHRQITFDFSASQ